MIALREWRRRRREAREAAHRRELARLREGFPGEPEHLIRAIAAGGIVASCALRAIEESRRRKADDDRIRKIVREELDAWRERARNGA